MSEFTVYGKNGLFHNVIKQSAILNGRYAVLPKGGPDMNLNNLLSGLELPQLPKYPGVFCLPPYSDGTNLQRGFQAYSFRLLFLTTTHATGDNQIKYSDPLTNTSLHPIEKDWSDMSSLATNFLYALESIQRSTRNIFILAQGEKWKVVRVSGVSNDNLSGVILSFMGAMPIECDPDDIDISSIVIPSETHQNHFH